MTVQVGAAHLEPCVGSIEQQTLPHDRFELVVVLDPSDGTSREVLDRARRRSPDLRIRVLESSALGHGDARNLALAAAAGDYVTFLGAEDDIGPAHLESVTQAAEPDVVVVAGAVPGSQDPQELFADGVSRLVGTRPARSVQYASRLDREEGALYWLELLAEHRLRVVVLDRGERGQGSRPSQVTQGLSEALQTTSSTGASTASPRCSGCGRAPHT